MINIKNVIKTVNLAINKNSTNFYTSVVVKNTDKPNYNNGIKQPIICSINHSHCKEFYSENSDIDIWKKKCPFGFTVSKKSFNTSTNYGVISTFSILSYDKENDIIKTIGNLPRALKPKKELIKNELESLALNYQKHLENKKYIDGLLETLLIGRIGLSIQSISHQFFTPLQGAMADVHNIENDSDVEESIKRLSNNFKSLEKLATEIQLILSTSQEFNTNMTRRVQVHLMVNGIFESLTSSAKEKNILLRQDFNSGSITVDAIPTQLYIVLSNIITNGIKYSYNGMVQKKLELRVSYDMDGYDYLIIKIINEGCKITEEEIRERLLFNLSYRGIYSGDRQRSGSGSGLYITSEIIKAHGGSIEVSSVYCGGNVDLNTDRYKNKFEIKWPITIE